MAQSRNNPYLERDFKSAHDWHIYHVYNDPEFIADYKTSGGWPDGNYQPLLKKYAINGYDIFFFSMRQILYLEKNIKRNGELDIDKENRKIILSFDLDLSKAEYLEMWYLVSTWQKFYIGEIKPKKRKPPENHQLIYATFKARKKHTFADIYRLYSEGKLPLYSGSTDQYKSEDSLESYYNKYKPLS